MRQLLRNKNARLLIAILLTALVMVIVIQTNIALAPYTTGSPLWVVIAGLTTCAIVFLLICVVICIQEPDAYSKAFKKRPMDYYHRRKPVRR